MKNILSYVKVFMEEFENKETKSLLFTGNTGVGKTFLSGCIAKRMIENGYDVAYHSAARMCEILDNYKFKKEDADTGAYDVKRLYNCELLIIDDLGTEFKTSYTLSAIYDLINSRHNNNRKIIINTNLSIIIILSFCEKNKYISVNEKYFEIFLKKYWQISETEIKYIQKLKRGETKCMKN